MKTVPNREGEASLAEQPPLPELFEDEDELEMIDGGEYDDDDDDTHNESAGASLIQTTSGATTTTVGGQQRSGEFSVIQSSPCTEQAPYRGGGHASPIPRLLPAVRRVSPPPAPLPLSTAPFDDSNVVTPDAPEAPELRSAAATTPSSPTAESASSTTFVDRIGAYFGYNGTDVTRKQLLSSSPRFMHCSNSSHTTRKWCGGPQS